LGAYESMLSGHTWIYSQIEISSQSGHGICSWVCMIIIFSVETWPKMGQNIRESMLWFEFGCGWVRILLAAAMSTLQDPKRREQPPKIHLNSAKYISSSKELQKSADVPEKEPNLLSLVLPISEPHRHPHLVQCKHIFGGSEVLVTSLPQLRIGPPIPFCPGHGGGWRKAMSVWHRSVTSL